MNTRIFSSVIDHGTVDIFWKHPQQDCQGKPCVQSSVVGELDVAEGSTREPDRATWLPKGTWSELYIIRNAWLILMGT